MVHENELQLTQNTQPAIYSCKLCNFKVLKDEFNFNNQFKYFAGHSLGEYSALVMCSSIRI